MLLVLLASRKIGIATGALVLHTLNSSNKVKQYEQYKESVKRGLDGLQFVSTGACPGCEDCDLPADCSDHDRELAEEPSFSWSACDCCGSTLGGNRHPAHGRDKNGDLMHLEVCQDCLYYINYGRLDDQTMLDIESSQ